MHSSASVNMASRSRRPGAGNPLPIWAALMVLSGLLLTAPGCTWLSHLGTTQYGSEYGRTYFIGGAGPIGNVIGTTSVPKGLRDANYRGSTEVFAWQSVVGGTLRDQMDRERNEDQARRLAARIVAYLDEYPGRRVNIVALSAGTGVATWTLEALPANYRVGTVVFLGSSLSRRYDLTAALAKVEGHLYNFSSTRDPLLKFGLPVTGTVDREDDGAGAAGLYGFILPSEADEATRELYRRRLRNRPYRTAYREFGNYGLHADATHEKFVSHVVAPLLMEDLEIPQDIHDYALPPALPPPFGIEITSYE